MQISEPLSRREMRASEPFEPSSICEQVRGSRLVLGRRFGRRFVFGRFWLLLVAFGRRMGRRFGRSLVAFGRRMGRRFVLVAFGRF
jgi:hypothetical protein